MAMGPERYTVSRADVRDAEIDVGLRKYMLGVYNYMCVAMLMTGLTAFAVSLNPSWMATIYGTPLKWVVMFAPLVMVFFLAARIHSMQAGTAQMMFWIYAVLVGISMSFIFVAYTGVSITRVFLITAVSFAGMSLWGYTTKKNLSGLRTFFMMGLIGLIVAMVVNFFLQSTMMQFVISVAGVLLFAGLTAYDTQQIKLFYSESDSGEVSQKKSIMGALKLYLDFLNMFLFMLAIFGGRE